MKSPRQQALFDDEPTAGDAAALVSVPKGKQRLSAAQHTFNRLTERIRRSRESLATWDAFMPRFQARVEKELRPIEREIRAAQRRFAIHLDQLLAASKPGKSLTRKRRAKIRGVLLDVAGEVLQSGPDAELEAIYDRHSDIPHAIEREEQMELAEAVLADILGEESIEGHEAQTVEELLHHAGERLHEAHADERRARAGRRRGGSDEVEQSKARAAQQATQSVREVYRKLVSALHPDRETDAAEHRRKTALMQRANQAYDRNDLLELLALQIEIEQIDAAALAQLPQARLGHYNEVLKEQVQVLETQLQAQTAPFRHEFGLHARDLTPQRVDQALSGRIAEARAMVDRIERTSKKLEDPGLRDTAIDELPEPEEDGPDPSELAILAAAFGEPLESPRRAGRARRRKR
jgi:curved DNA-binding protein CbpA